MYMYTLFERAENGNEVEIEKFRSNTAKEVFDKFANENSIVKTSFDNARKLYIEFCKNNKCSAENNPKYDWENFCKFMTGNNNMPIIYYSETVYPSWFGFEDDLPMDYIYMVRKTSGKMLVQGKLMPRFYIGRLKVIEDYDFNEYVEMLFNYIKD